MPAIQLVIFDCDGVLVDSERICNQVMADLLGELGLVFSLDQTVARFMGRSMAQCVQIITGLLGRPPPEEFLARFADRTRAALAEGLAPVPGIEAVLAHLTLPCCVGSNGNRAKMTFTLGLTGLLPRFADRLYCADDVVHPKPAPDLFLHAARCQGAQPARCVVVEDTPTGIMAARAAGMWAFGFAAMTPRERLEQAGAHVVFSAMSELPALLDLHDRPVHGK